MEKVLIVGIGGAGCSIAAHLQVAIGARAVAVNTDRSGLENTPLQEQLLIGVQVCNGNNAHSPARGRKAAENSQDQLREVISGTQLLVLVAGLGGGAGTGAAPIVAQLAQDQGADVIAAVTMPFAFEGAARSESAVAGLLELQKTKAKIVIHDHSAMAEERGGGNESLSAALESAASRVSEEVAHHVNEWSHKVKQ